MDKIGDWTVTHPLLELESMPKTKIKPILKLSLFISLPSAHHNKLMKRAIS